ncbi:MAG: T9SS type A sorting domain-containing protein [Candidatus Eisenbacteria bacterium]
MCSVLLRRVATAAAALAVIVNLTGFASAGSPEDRRDWTEGYTLVLLSPAGPDGVPSADGVPGSHGIAGADGTTGGDGRAGNGASEGADRFVRLRNALESLGMRIGVAVPPRVILGWIPPEHTTAVSTLPGVEGVFTVPLPEAALRGMDDPTARVVAFFNSVASGSSRERRTGQEFPLDEGESSFPPLIDDALEPDASDMDAYLKNLRAAGVDVERLYDLNEADPALDILGNSDDMEGTVTVTIFFVESDGSMDPDQYTWSTAARSSTLNSAVAALSWWSDRAAGYGKSLSFTVQHYPGTDGRCQTGYEPILHSSSEVRYWVEEIMASFGYSSGSHFDRVRAYNTWARSAYGTDWAYSAFVEYNPPPAGAAFTDGAAAWAYLGGPYTNLLYRTFGWTFDRVYAHETGHIFFACDEYYEPGYGGCTSCGPCSDGINNGNCEYCNPQAVTCMMRYNDWSLCAFTPGHLGWLEGPIVKYFSHLIDDASGNNNGVADPGETVAMPVTLKNWGLPLSAVSATLFTSDPYITITSSSSSYPDMPLNARSTSTTPYAFRSVPGTPVAHPVTFTLTIVGAGYDTTITLDVRIGETPVLLVDDDGGGPYESYYASALNAAGFSYAYWNVATQGSPPLSELSRRKVVIWFTSMEAFLSLTGLDERNLQAYLDGGGSLFLSSQDYLGERFEDFATNYLHVAAFTADVYSDSEGGVAGDPVSDGLDLTMDYPFSNYSDDITPGANAGSILINSTGNPGALRYPAIGTAPYRVVYFAFPFEAVANSVAPNNRTTVMRRVIEWLLEPQDYQPPSVAIVAPDGGEKWGVGSEQEITWVASDNFAVDSVSLYYSIDGGASFPHTIASGEENDSVYTWVIPDTPSDSCVVKIVAYDSSLNVAEDVSTGLFLISSDTIPEIPPEDVRFELVQNHPNPFNSVTSIEFYLDARERISLAIYDVTGKVVKTLVRDTLSEGKHLASWSGNDETERAVSSGVYICRLESERKSTSKKMVLCK